jgi:hypothetical protein
MAWREDNRRKATGTQFMNVAGAAHPVSAGSGRGIGSVQRKRSADAGIGSVLTLAKRAEKRALLPAAPPVACNPCSRIGRSPLARHAAPFRGIPAKLITRELCLRPSVWCLVLSENRYP